MGIFIMTLKIIYFIISVLIVGCTNPLQPSSHRRLSDELNITYERLEGVRDGDPDYGDAVKWSSICPQWGLLK